MHAIEGILIEPVGCLAEFPPEPFLDIAFRVFGRERKPSHSGSRSYWHLLNLMQAAGEPFDDAQRALAESLELEAVAGATVYEDVVPALAALHAMGVRMFLVSSLSAAALARFLDRHSLRQFFSAAWNRDNAGGVKTAPLRAALAGATVPKDGLIFLADTLESLKLAQSLGVQSVLMMNDPDEARRLAMHNPSGGIVSLHELPDFIRLVAAENSRALQLERLPPNGTVGT